MGRIVHFEIMADDPERCMAYYSAVLNWTFEKWEGPVNYWLATTGPADQPGIDGAVKHRVGRVVEDVFTQFTCTADVADISATLEAVAAYGGGVVQDRMAIPGVGWHAYARDTEGNVFGLMQRDESAG
jgi:hypothetical protein